MSKEMSFNGMFYPNSCEEIKGWISSVKKSFEFEKKEVKAAIVPHAGYIYSGENALSAYLKIKKTFSNIVLVGPSHRVAFSGASIGLFDSFKTPCGEIENDLVLAKELKERFSWLSFLKEAHNEHSTEVQLPFIKNVFEGVKVVEIVYSDISLGSLVELLDFCVNKDTLLLISSDLSHFYTLDETKKLDENCLLAIKELDLSKLKKCEACGIMGIGAIIEVAKKRGWKSSDIKYTTSFDRSKDASSVVGYASALFN